MYHILEHVRNSQNAKICLLLGFCFITTVIFLSRSGDTERVQLSERPETLIMGSDMVVGGLGGVLQKDPEVVEVVEQVKPALEERSGKKFESIEVIHYKPQLVAGRNYFVKARAKEVGGVEQIIHLRIYKDIKRQVELTAYELDKKLEDEVKYFQ